MIPSVNNTSTSSGLGTRTVSHTVGATSNLLIICVSEQDGANGDISGVTYNGVDLTLAKLQSNSVEDQASIYYLLNPATGANDATVTYTTGERLVVGVMDIIGADGTSPIGATGGGITGTASVTTTRDDSLVIDCQACVNNGSITVGASQTQLYNVELDLGEPNVFIGASSTEDAASPGSITMSWSGVPASGENAQAVAEILSPRRARGSVIPLLNGRD